MPAVSASPGPTAGPTAPPRPAPPDVPVQGTGLVPAAQVAAPVRLSVPAVGIDIAVAPVGVLDTGVMELPAQVDVAGWYRFGSAPSSATGTTVLAAHVDSLKYGRGPFSRLKELAVGSPITVTTSDGATRDYLLASSERIPKREIPLDAVFDREGAARLVLITCGGQFDHETGHYLDNILVTATPVAG